MQRVRGKNSETKKKKRIIHTMQLSVEAVDVVKLFIRPNKWSIWSFVSSSKSSTKSFRSNNPGTSAERERE